MIEIKTIDSKRTWEDFIRLSKIPTSFFQSWNWGEFEESRGTTVYRLGFYQEEELIGVGQAFETDARRGHFLHFRNGPVIRWSDRHSAEEILRKIREFAQEKNADFIRISPLVKPSSDDEKLIVKTGYTDSQMHDVDAEITWMLDITQSEEAILNNMRKNTRYYIRKAERDGVKIIRTDDPERVEDFWPIYQDTVVRQQWHAYPLQYLQGEFEHFRKDGAVSLFLAKYEGKYIAGAMFIYYNDQVYYHHSGSLTDYRKITAPYLIQWHSIKEAKRRGYKLYNFFGIARDDDPKHPWHGLTFFKKGFGGFEQRWMHAKDRPLKLRYWLTNFYERLERMRRGYK